MSSSAPAEAAGPPLPPEPPPPPERRGALRLVGAGIITGAADDDPSAIGTYAAAGARFGFGFLWVAPVLLPMMIVVTYLSAKLGRVYGKGLFAAIRDRYPGKLLVVLMLGAFAGNLLEAAANLGGLGAGIGLFVPLPAGVIVVVAAAAILVAQVAGSYDLIRSVFQWLALALLGYVGAALLARPDPAAVLRATFVPHIRLDADFLFILVACLGTSLSAYVYTWQSNQEVEEQVAEGRRRPWQRRGATGIELARTRRDVVVGMIFSNLILYAIILATASTLHAGGTTSVDSAAEAARALEPFAGRWATLLFAVSLIGVGFLAVPVMTIGAAYDLTQGLGRENGLYRRLGEAPFFYGTIVAVTLVAALFNLLGFNPMRVLVWSGIVQGFSVPPLLLVMMILTNDRTMMGEHVNGPLVNVVGGVTTLATWLAAGALLWRWVMA